MRDRRRNKAERELSALEDEYRARLAAALRRCADGVWGLFGQNEHLEELPGDGGRRALTVLGTQIEALRGRLGMAEPFAPHARLLALRGRKSENDPGEPKLARAWLAELDP